MIHFLSNVKFKFIFSSNISKLYAKAFASPVSYFRLLQRVKGEDAFLFFILVSLINFIVLFYGLLFFRMAFGITLGAGGYDATSVLSYGVKAIVPVLEKYFWCFLIDIICLVSFAQIYKRKNTFGCTFKKVLLIFLASQVFNIFLFFEPFFCSTLLPSGLLSFCLTMIFGIAVIFKVTTAWVVHIVVGSVLIISNLISKIHFFLCEI
ncbi:hypothetical protein [Dethiosulfatarculus sandiegensis]|uniref:Yip1 domain-containing protein n=1 Tax=Dethiosulfatarculus sandiegensis TaxID=1429043 RepID=A0A0D2J6Z2_9BACT|nr:hypothetical protein [Dethiosulfatarculus sandiegensis]KIX13944.1 hypothetical protein X474_12435 [Dethiosulfatarculus sandiegensis]